MSDLDGEHDRLDAASFDRVASFIRTVSGIKLPVAKRTMLEGRLRRPARALALESLELATA